ncbi:aminoglycoside phosphotransferase [Azorhizobium oxalatiphilum]|uniref:Aminoglycoside phosphotransferase n=1 Tax=Azorhizobium oxalatiphilum TaxID=980631 RepID=A0A917FFI1_9HYPH|nr:phosphotransferase [Azorhizobium oxalatiphilum]GGF70844.1 aminoglycoside phosphotransferase [Azorhizobium oxalatiphilum]
MSGVYDDGFLARTEAGLKAALPRWGLAPETELSLLTISENATFRATSTGQGDLVFRVHRPGYHSRVEIGSELAWISALRAGEVVTTPRPVPLRDGSLIGDLDDAGTLRHVVAFEFVPGAEPAADAELAGWFRQLGGIHATLHAHARSWQRPDWFTRKRWNFASMLGGRPLWGDWRAGLGLDAAGRAHLQRAVDLLERQCATMCEHAGNFGLVHADLRLANLLVDGTKLALIDFDDCGFSWFLYDFAAAISFIEHEPYLPELQDAWVEGYRAIAPLSAEDVERLQVFVMLRRILLTAWIASHYETPTAHMMGTAYTDGTLVLAERFLARFG